jgi:cobalt-zinc-cadmium efflux system outer membrane protein
MGERLGAAVRVEELERDRILKEWEVRRLEIRSRVQGSFAAALYMEEAVKLQSEIFLWSESAVAIARKRLEAGDALPEEVARAEMEQLRAGLEVERAKSVREGSLVALAAAMGESGMRIESVSGALEVTLEIPSLEIILSNLARSLFVEAAEAEVRLERAREKSVRAQRIPDINLDLFYRRQEATRTDAFDAGIGVALPLFDRSQGRLQEAGAVVVAAESRARSIRSESERQLREACLKLTRTMSQAHFLKNDIFPRIDTVVRAAERRYAGGDLSLSEILPIRRDRTSARLTCLESLRDVLEAWASLKPFISGAYQ